MTRAILNLCKLSAYLGGFLLCALILLIVISVAGRAAIGIGLGPVPGDFELVEMGMGIAIFFFMPWCYIKGGHATVDLLYVHMQPWQKRVVDTASDLLMFTAWLVMTWMLWEGLLEKKEFLETTFILQMPVWWSYAVCFFGSTVGCIAYLAKTLNQLGLVSELEGWTVEANLGH